MRILTLLFLLALPVLGYGQVDANTSKLATATPESDWVFDKFFFDFAIVKYQIVDGKGQMHVDKIGNRKVLGMRTVTMVQVEEKTRTVVVDGKEVESKYTVPVQFTKTVGEKLKYFVPTEKNRSAPADTAKAYRLDGEEISRDAIAEEFKAPRSVLLLTRPVDKKNPVDPWLASLFHDDIVLLFLPAESAPEAK